MFSSQNPSGVSSRKVIGAIALFVLGVLIGRITILHSLGWGDNVSNIRQVTGLYSVAPKDTVDFRQFWEVWDSIKARYVDQPVSDTQLFYGAIEGLVGSLDDPHSVYFPPKEAEDFARDLSGEFEGIGAEIGVKEKILTVIAPLPKSPAEQAGLRAGDMILLIDKEETVGLTLEQAVAKIRGPEGTSVTLTIFREGAKGPTELTIRRSKITVPTVITKDLGEGLWYMRVSYFNQETAGDTDKAIRELLRHSPKGLVLDLRSNPGGFLDSSVDLASEWISDGVIVRERNAAGEEKTHDTTGRHRLVGMKTIILVDRGTASGAEIVAGALQDYGAAILVGEKTYGKGSVQDFEILPDRSALKLTIAKWLTPKKREIDHEGIVPDIVIENMYGDETVTTPTSTPSGEPIDLGLDKAKELLKRP